MSTDHTITVYNRHMDKFSDEATWYKRTFKCHLETTDGLQTGSENKERIHNATAFIPLSGAPKGLTYVVPEVFQATIDCSKIFTFSAEDIVYIGEVTSEETMSGRAMTAFKKEHPGYYSVVSCDYDNFGSLALRHWEVSCVE